MSSPTANITVCTVVYPYQTTNYTPATATGNNNYGYLGREVRYYAYDAIRHQPLFDEIAWQKTWLRYWAYLQVLAFQYRSEPEFQNLSVAAEIWRIYGKKVSWKSAALSAGEVTRAQSH